MTAPAVVVGASLAGLATALALAEQGHPVRVLEGSAPPPAGPAADAAEKWCRPTVPQSDHSHMLTSLGVRVLRRRAPRLLETALDEGARLVDLTRAAPLPAAGRGADGRAVADPELVALGARRPFFDLLLHRAVLALPNVTVEHGTRVRGLLLESGRVRGVVTRSGTHVPARIVVDATGRAARARSWLADAGIPVGADLTDRTDLRAFTRFYRLLTTDGALPGPLNRGSAAGGVWDHYAAVVHPADNGVFGVTVGVPVRDPATAPLSSPAAFTAAVSRSPFVAEWVTGPAAAPLTGVRTIAMPPNILRFTARPGERQVPGLFAVGDAACVTDPVYGRGMSLALEHAFRLAELLDVHSTAGAAQSAAAAHLGAQVYGPWYEQSVYESRERLRLWRTRVGGIPEPRTPPGPPDRPTLAEMAAAAVHDPLVWHGLARVLMSLDAPASVFDTAEFRERVRGARPHGGTAADARTAVLPSSRRPPTRAELLAAIAEAAA